MLMLVSIRHSVEVSGAQRAVWKCLGILSVNRGCGSGGRPARTSVECGGLGVRCSRRGGASKGDQTGRSETWEEASGATEAKRRGDPLVLTF